MNKPLYIESKGITVILPVDYNLLENLFDNCVEKHTYSGVEHDSINTFRVWEDFKVILQDHLDSRQVPDQVNNSDNSNNNPHY